MQRAARHSRGRDQVTPCYGASFAQHLENLQISGVVDSSNPRARYARDYPCPSRVFQKGLPLLVLNDTGNLLLLRNPYSWLI
ncbi:MAG: hypothetical protein ACFFD4_04405 [Candidatus Odinarchaeota archaeon]